MIEFGKRAADSSANYLIGLADILLAYTMLSPIIFLFIGAHVKLTSDFLRTLVVLLGGGIVSGIIYLRFFGIGALKRNKSIVLLVSLFTFLVFVSSVKHFNNQSTREALKFFVGYCVFGFFVALISNMSISRSKRLVMIWTLFAIGFSVYAIHESWPVANRRFDLTGINNAQFGMLFYFLALCGLFGVHLVKKLALRVSSAVVLLVCFLIAFYSGTRTAFLGFLISVALYVVSVLRYSSINRSKAYRIISFSCVILISFTMILLPYVNQAIRTRYVAGFESVEGLVKYWVSSDASAYDSIDRLRIWNDALEKFKANPLLGSEFGVLYRDKVANREYVHPHNLILEILAETGYLGFFVFFFLFGLIVIRASSINKQMAAENRFDFLIYPLCLLFFFLYSTLHSDLSTEYFKWYFAGFITGFDPKESESCRELVAS